MKQIGFLQMIPARSNKLQQGDKINSNIKNGSTSRIWLIFVVIVIFESLNASSMFKPLPESEMMNYVSIT